MNFSKKRPVKIVMLGAGGTGAHIAPHLYRLLYALERPVKFIICDGDKVEPKNLVRQNFTEADLGENKARVIAERYSDVFGLETSYIPRFIEDAGQLEELLRPEVFRHYVYGSEPNTGRWVTNSELVILIGAVDNNKSRKLCHEVFLRARDLVYIDSGNGEYTGQIVCGIRRAGKTVYYRLTADLCGIICDNFEQVRIHRFLDREFKQFKQVVVTGVRRRRTEAEQDAEALCSAAEHPETLPTADLLPKACYELPAVSKKVETFRGAVFNEDELARQLANSTGFDRLFAKSRLDSEIKRPPLPLSIGQVGLIGGSGLINGLMECDYPHIVKGRIIKEKHTVTDENRGPHGRLISTEIRETISNRMIFNILTPSGFRSLT